MQLESQDKILFKKIFYGSFQMAYESVKHILEYCRKETLSPISKIDQILPSIFLLIIENSEGEILSEALQTLEFLTDRCDDIVIENEAVKRIILLLSQNDIQLKKHAINILCNVILRIDEQMQLHLLSYFPLLVTHHNDYIRLKSMSGLSKLAAFSKAGKQAITETNLLPIISNNLKSDNLDTTIHAVDIINKYAFEAMEHQIIYLFSTGIISTYFDLLKCETKEIFNVMYKIYRDVL